MFCLCYSLQERHLGVGVSPEKDNEACERTRAQVLWVVGIVQPEKRGKVGEDTIAISLTA